MYVENDYVFRYLRRPAQDEIDEPLSAHYLDTYLHELCRQGAPPELVEEAVLKLGANIDVTNRNGITPLSYAVQEGNVKLVACLLKLGARICIDLGNGKFCNAVAQAVYKGETEILSLLLRNNGGYFVNTPHCGNKDMENFPPLALIVESRNADMRRAMTMIKPLVAAGAFLERENGVDSLTPLMRAVFLRHGEMIEALLEAGAQPNYIHSKTGKTALHLAIDVMRNSADVITLLKAGADPNTPAQDGSTPLMRAVQETSLDCIRALIEYGADVNAQRPSDKKTALHLAAEKYSYISSIIYALIDAGADPLLTDAFNRTAAKTARESGRYNNNIGVLEDVTERAEQKLADKLYRKHKYGT